MHPGIVCDGVAAIFEEHKIVPALDPFVAQDGFAFSRGDNTFSFGPVIAEMVPEASSDGEEGRRRRRARVARGSLRGVSAKFKISNASKVPCSVDFTLTPKVDGGATDETFPMEVHPSRLDVPPHEHRYVTACFVPVAIGTFASRRSRRTSWTVAIPRRNSSRAASRARERSRTSRSRPRRS